MHEAAITEAILGQALAEAERVAASRVTRIRLLLGEQGGVMPECVRFYFEALSRGTRAEGAELEFTRVPLRLRCPECGAEFGAIDELCECNAGAEVVSGQEMVIESIDVEEA